MADGALKIVGTAIYGLLSASTDVTNIISTNGIWLGAAHASVPRPYVIFNLMAGGDLNNSKEPAFDIWMLVTGISADQDEAVRLSGAIRTALREKEPAYSDGYSPFAPVTELTPYMARVTIEGSQFWQVGAIYRFRGILENV